MFFLCPPETCLIDQRRMLKHEKYGNRRMASRCILFKMQIPLSLETEIGGMVFPEMMYCSCRHCKFTIINFFPHFKANLNIFWCFQLQFDLHTINGIYTKSIVYAELKDFSSVSDPECLHLYNCTYAMQPTKCPTFDL